MSRFQLFVVDTNERISIEWMEDRIGEALWYLAILSPLVSMLLFWRLKRVNWFTRISLGVSIGLAVGLLFLFFSMAILFRDGMGLG